MQEKIAVSILNLKKLNRKDLIKKLLEIKQMGFKRIHFDVMDKKFIGHTALKTKHLKIVKKLGFIINVHLMVGSVARYLKKYRKHSDYISFHVEQTQQKDISLFLKKYANAGVAISPSTSWQKYEQQLLASKIVTVMSVVPGKGGQKFIPEITNKIREIRNFFERNNCESKIEVDGGVNDQTFNLIHDTCDFAVMGSFVTDNPNIKDWLLKN